MTARYQVKEIFGPTLQGEGPHAGWPCVFVRLAGCNAWDGRAETRAASACPYCDTDFRGGSPHSIAMIGDQLDQLVNGNSELGCVLSGGEPLLQADEALLSYLGSRFPWVDIETNGTRPAPARPENVTIVCSPKFIPKEAIQVQPDAWKVLIPAQEAFLPTVLTTSAPVYLQPVCPDDGPKGVAYEHNLARCVALCQEHGCRLSLQTHKYLGIE